ncbi:hypothetical protein PVAP13_1KG123754 [Panicum virgatum]|uniref:Uncharacterized protein n=1 Tax=Panicum virgatum TaxID=38727 RepID=A0A8T0XDM7_PANVG|nr:hypothetical protein PVAP13_1KG123754 [Panicum virgatum]
MLILLSRLSTGQPAKLLSWVEHGNLMQNQFRSVYPSICFTPKSHGNLKQISGSKAMEKSKSNQTEDMILPLASPFTFKYREMSHVHCNFIIQFLLVVMHISYSELLPGR